MNSTAAESPDHVIVPAGGEVRVHDLVLTAIEVREEQYDHKPGHGDVLAATLHVRAAGTPAPSSRDMAAQSDALVRVRSDAGAQGTRWQHLRFVLTGGDRNAIVLAVTRVSAAGSLGGTGLKLAADQGAGAAAGLAVTVLAVVEKFMTDGDTMMRVRLHVRRAGTPAPPAADMLAQQDSLVTLTSEPGCRTSS